MQPMYVLGGEGAQHPPKSGHAVFNLPGAPAFSAVGAIAKMATLQTWLVNAGYLSF